MDPNHSGDVSEDEFLLILKYIQQKSKQQSTLPQLSQHNTSRSHSEAMGGSQSISQMNEDRQKYGSLLPKSGVYFLPDEKVVGFLK